MNDTLEEFIDREGLQAVLEALSTICYEKASHVESNWQDADLARAWRKAGTAFGEQASRSIFALP